MVPSGVDSHPMKLRSYGWRISRARLALPSLAPSPIKVSFAGSHWNFRPARSAMMMRWRTEADR